VKSHLKKRPDPLLLDEQLCFALYSTSLAMTKAYKPLLESLGLTYPQYLVLLTLWENDGIPLRELAERLHQDSGALTPIVKRLEAEGHVRRERDPGDERNLAIVLTESGRALRQQAKRVNAAIAVACGLDGDDAAKLRQTLHALRASLTQ
jgi:MarR family transcriptional regulator, organic hydroperoxide resistance regulator